jgi:hypothetical protein
MPALMAYRLVPLLLVVVLAGACGKEIGDACAIASDCSPNGDRLCDPDSSSPVGYCTIMGCDYSTCPGEAACIRFFTGSFANRVCDPARLPNALKAPGEMCMANAECSGNICNILPPPQSGEPPPGMCAPCTQDQQCASFCNLATGNCDECSLDETCALEGQCVPRSSEVRYCMRTCDSDGDCRDGYECRDLEKMKAHGGEPLLAPGVPIDAHAPKFCAAKPTSS